MKSLIFTYENMIKNKFVNYKIIYNIRKIKIKNDYDINKTSPFYNVNIKKYLLDEKYFNAIKDNYTNEKIIDSLNNVDNFIEGEEYKFYLTDNNDLIFYKSAAHISFLYSNLNSLELNGNINNILDQNNPILNYLNYTFQIINNNIVIQTYTINNNHIDFVEYQQIQLNEANEEHEIFADSKSNKVYFFFKKLKKLIILENNENTNFFDKKEININHSFQNNNVYKFFDNKMYILSDNNFIEINLDNLKEKKININKGEYGNFIDYDDLNILLVVSLDDKKYYFNFINKTTFVLDKEKYYFETINNYGSTFVKLEQKYIFYGGYIFYITEEKKIIPINYYHTHFNFKNIDYFKKNGNINFILLYREDSSINLQKIILLDFQPPEYNINFKFFKQSKYYELNKKYDYDKMPVRKFELFNILKKRILTCPYCPIIPHFDINLNVKIGCYFHPNSIYKYDIDDFLYYYNDLHSQKCFYCGTNNDLLFDLMEAEKFPYTCNNCLNEYKANINNDNDDRINMHSKLIDINNSNKCIFHNKNIKYIFNLCEDCINTNMNYNRHREYFLDIENCNNFEDYNYNPNLNEALENIFYSKNEIEELKSKIKIIEAKINDYFKKNINDIRLNSEKEQYFKYLYFSLNIYNSFIYTYEYFSKNKCLNYRIISNLRKIKLLPNFNIDKKELFFINISMNRFLNGQISKKDNEIHELYDKLPCNYYINKIDVQTDGTLYLKKKYYFIDFGISANVVCVYIYIYSNNKIEKSNLKEIIFNNNPQHDAFEIFKFNNVMVINNSNLICIFENNEIRIYSYKIQDNECIFELYQNIKFSSTFNNLECRKNYIQEEDGSKFYLLYENAFVTISKGPQNYQIENIIMSNEGRFISFDKFNNKIYILKEANQIAEIDPINFNTKFLAHPTDVDAHIQSIIEEQQNFRGIEDFYIINNKYSLFSIKYFHFRYGIIKNVFIFNREEQAYIEFQNDFTYLIRIEKYGNQFIFIHQNTDISGRKLNTHKLRFYKFENNKLIYIKTIFPEYDNLGYEFTLNNREIYDDVDKKRRKKEEEEI